MYIKSEESSGVNTEGGLSGPELEIPKAEGGSDCVDVLVIFWTGGSNEIGLCKMGGGGVTVNSRAKGVVELKEQSSKVKVVRKRVKRVAYS